MLLLGFCNNRSTELDSVISGWRRCRSGALALLQAAALTAGSPRISEIEHSRPVLTKGLGLGSFSYVGFSNQTEEHEQAGRSTISRHLPEPPKVCRIMAFWARFRCLGPLFFLLLGSR